MELHLLENNILGKEISSPELTMGLIKLGVPNGKLTRFQSKCCALMNEQRMQGSNPVCSTCSLTKKLFSPFLFLMKLP